MSLQVAVDTTDFRSEIKKESKRILGGGARVDASLAAECDLT